MTEQVTLDYSVTGNYSATLAQMVQQSSAFARETDSVIAKLNAVNAATLTVVNRTTALTGANKVATAEAAAYQQVMGRIQANAKVLGQDYERLERTTLKLARSLPGGFGEAVRIVEKLQASGVTTERQIDRMGTAFAKLGKATGSDPTSVGGRLLELNRIYGNSDDSLERYGDTLVALTKKYGASAEGALAYAKALAPVAANAGIGENAVLAIGTAAARLGEDGYAGANAFNKVLLDIQRSVRDGTPELSEYAKMLGLSRQGLADLFKDDPTEALVRFTEAVRTNTPEAQRSLDALGFDSTRTVRAIQALSGQGNLRTIIDDSTASYGQGSTDIAARSATAGVNDQLSRLRENVGQTSVGAGRPFLGFLEGTLRGANAVTGATARVANSAPAQDVGTLAAATNGVVDFGTNALGALGLGALGVAGYNALRRGTGNFLSGARGVATGAPAPDTRLGNLGAAAGRAGFTPGAGGLGSAWARAGQTAAGVANAAFNVGALATNATTAGMQGAMAGAPRPLNLAGTPLAVVPSPARGVFAAGMAQAGSEASAGISAARTGAVTTGLTNLAAAARTSAVTVGNTTRAFLTAEGGAQRLGAALTRAALQAPLFVGQTAGRAISPLTGALGGIGPTLALAGAFAGGAVVYDRARDARRFNEASGTMKDAYAAFNEFAAVAGVASRGLTDLTQATTETTRAIVAQNRTRGQALNVTATEFAQTQRADYTRAFNPTGRTVEQVGLETRLLLGADASPESLSRAGLDVADKYGQAFAQAVLKDYEQRSQDRGVPFGETLQLAVSQRNLFGSTERSQQVWQTYAGAVADEQSYLTSTYGEQAAPVYNLAQARQAFESVPQTNPAALGAGRALAGEGNPIANFIQTSNAESEAAGQIAQLLGTDPRLIESFYASSRDTNDFDELIRFAQESQQTNDGNFFQRLGRESGRGRYSPSAYAFLENVDQYGAQAFAAGGPDYVSGMASSEEERASRRLSEAIDATTGNLRSAGDDLTETLYGVSQQIRDGVEPELAEIGTSTSNRAFRAFAANPGDYGLQTAAAQEAAGVALRGQPNSQVALVDLLAQAGRYSDSGNVGSRTFSQGAALVQRQAALDQTGRGLYERTGQSIQAAGAARAVLATGDVVNEQARGQLEQISAGEPEAYRERLSAMASFVSAYRQFTKELVRSDEDAQRTRLRAQRDFDRSRADSQADYERTVRRSNQAFAISQSRAGASFTRSTGRAERDFGRQVVEAREDFGTSRARAAADFRRQEQRAEADFALQRQRSQRDLERGETRARDDYQLDTLRSQRDFLKGQTRAVEDYHRSRLRAQRDFAKQLMRINEDAAASMYDPYKRIQAAQTWDANGLLANIREQTEAMTRQVAQLDQARSLGLSQTVIDQLKLFDPSNAQQLDRLMNDILGNPGFIAQLNDAAGVRSDASSGLVGEDVSTRRAKEDFAQSLSDQETDLQLSLERSRTDFASAMADREADFAKSLARSREDFNTSLADSEADFRKALDRSSEDYRTSMERNEEDFNRAEARAAKNHAVQMADVAEDFAIASAQAAEDHARAMSQMTEDFTISVQRASRNFEISMTDMTEDLQRFQTRALQDMADFGWEITGGPSGVATAFARAAEDLDGRIANLPAQLRPQLSRNLQDMVSNADADLQYYLDQKLGKYGLDHTALTTTQSNPGFNGKGGLSKIGLSGGGLVEGSGTGTSDSIDIRVSRGEYVINAERTRQWGVDRMDMLNAGINPWDRSSTSARAPQARMGEREPEKLSRRFISPAGMGADQVRAARTQPYSVPVINTTSNNYVYDHSVNVAQVDVRADNPRELAEGLRRKVTFARLVQPERADRVVV
jgi:TP901 family phage tail tape measure protein